MIIAYKLWADVGKHLKTHKYLKQYVTPEQYISQNPLESLVALPDIPEFFATKVCNIFIVAIPFGWDVNSSGSTTNWPPAGYDDAKQRHIDTYAKYTKYETHVYMDMFIVQKIMAANSNSKFEEMMAVTKANMAQMCSDLAEYGFKLEADITAEVGPDHFYPVIDAFYSPTLE